MSERQKELMLKMFKDNGNVLTTRDFLKCELSAEYRKIISLLRKDGHNIPKPRLNRKSPGKNKYILLPPNEQNKPKSNTKPTTMQEAGWKQETSPCVCGSWYTKRGKCNNVKCGKER